MATTTNEPLHILLLGLQGAGKGTQALLLAKKYGLVHINTGGLLRKMIAGGSELGKQINEIIHVRGDLVPFELAEKVVQQEISSLKPEQGFVLDGSPRQEQEARDLLAFLHENGRMKVITIYLSIGDEEAVARMSNRLVCEKFGHPVQTAYTEMVEKCPHDGSKLIHRLDDQPAQIQRRLAIAHEKLTPMIEYLKTQMPYFEVDGERPIQTVANDVQTIVEKYI